MFLDVKVGIHFLTEQEDKTSLNYKLVDSMILDYECFDLIQISIYFSHYRNLT